MNDLYLEPTVMVV